MYRHMTCLGQQQGRAGRRNAASVLPPSQPSHLHHVDQQGASYGCQVHGARHVRPCTVAHVFPYYSLKKLCDLRGLRSGRFYLGQQLPVSECLCLVSSHTAAGK